MQVYDELSDDIIKQKQWSEAELRKRGYEYYLRKKELTMVRELPASEAPKRIRTSDGQELIAQAGYLICYRPGDHVRPRLDDYEHWPVEPSVFSKTYRQWDRPDWEPNAAVRHLMRLGCQPYYKCAGVWAKRLTQDALLQSMEHRRPVLVEAGEYVAVGVDGEPYSMGEKTFHSRYERPTKPAISLSEKLKKLLGRV
ncbi:MAG: hypothetical protein SF029_07745 [bacterium]|nr:hypothetical protein [bacterium]